MFNRIAAFSILMLSLLSCSLEENEGNVGMLKKITFAITHDSPATRTSLSGMDVLWSENDCISVFSNGANAKFTATSHSEASVAFTGMIEPSGKYYAVYPYSDKNAVTSDVIKVTLPENQYPQQNSFDPSAAIMAGVTSNEENIDMYNACAFLRFELQNEDVTQVSFQTIDAEPITGCHELSFQEGDISLMPGEEVSDVVNISINNSLPFKPGVYYACVSPGEVSGIKVTFKFADGSYGVKQNDQLCTLLRNWITDFGVIDDNVVRDFVDDGTDDTTVAASAYGFDYEGLLQQNHPRLFMNEQDFINLKRKVNEQAQSNVFLKLMHDNIIANADKYVSERVPAYQAEDNLDESRLGLQHIFACAYAYKMTAEKKYLDKAVADLMAFCSFADWHPEQYLCVGETTMGVAIGYDWLYGHLTSEQRELIREKLYSYAIGTYKDYYSKFSYSSNWNEVCWGGLTVASIALFGKKVTAGDTEMGNTSLIDLLEMNMNPSEKGTNAYQLPLLYGPDGSFDEGYSYWNYGTSYEIAMIKALETAFGKTASGIVSLVNSDGFLKTDTYMQFMESPLGGSSYATFSYADGGTSTARVLWPLFWFADHKHDYSVLAGEIKKYLSGMYTAENCSSRMFPLMMCLIKDMDIDQYFTTPIYPTQRLWHGGDRVQLIIGRDKWSGNATDAYFAMKGGYPNRSHGHMDAGSFVFDYNGERWSHDIPLPWTYNNANAKIDQYDTDSSKDYGNLSQGSGRWWFFFTNNLAHSTISVMNGSLGDKSNVSDQLVGASTSHADIEQIINTADEIGGKMNLTPMYSDNLSSIKRTIKMVTEGGEFKKLVIIDEISCFLAKPQIQWRMLTPASVQTKEGYQELTQNGKTMYLQAKVTGNITSPEYHVWEATTDEIDGWKNPVDRNYTDHKGYYVAGFSATISWLSTVTITTTITDNINNL